MNDNVFISFIKELIQRFATKSPKFFRVLQIIAGAVTAVTGIPALLSAYKIPLPEAVTFLQNKYAGSIALGMFIASMLTTQSKIVGVDPAGQPLKKTNEDLLPFTAKQEQKKVEQKPVDTLTPDCAPTNQRNNPN